MNVCLLQARKRFESAWPTGGRVNLGELHDAVGLILDYLEHIAELAENPLRLDGIEAREDQLEHARKRWDEYHRLAEATAHDLNQCEDQLQAARNNLREAITLARLFNRGAMSWQEYDRKLAALESSTEGK